MNKFHGIIRSAVAFLVTLGLVGLVLAGCGDDSPTGPEEPTGKRILVLEDGGTEAHVLSQLRAAGFNVRSGGLFHEFTGDGLDWADAVVLLTGVEYNHDLDDRGEAALVTFVNEGGGLMTIEWLCFSVSRSSFHQTLDQVIPVYYDGFYAQGEETWSVSVDHPVTDGLPASFRTPADTQFSRVRTRSGATMLVQGSRSASSVATWTRGGRVVSWSSAGAYGGTDVWNAELNRLLVNTVGFISRR